MANPRFEIELTQYNYDTRQVDNLGTVSISTLARCIKAEQMASLIEGYLNGGGGDSPAAHRTIAKFFTTTHRTLQGAAVRFFLGVVAEYSKEYEKTWAGFTDARNENAGRVAKKIEEMMADEYIPFI